MTETKHIQRLEKMVADRRELLCRALAADTQKEIRADIEAIEAVLENVNALRNRDTEIQDLMRKCAHEEAVAKSLKDEVNKLRYELGNLQHTELEEAKKPKPCHEVLFHDGSSVCIENAACWNIQPDFTRLKYGDGDSIAIFMTTDVRGIIRRGKRENNED